MATPTMNVMNNVQEAAAKFAKQAKTTLDIDPKKVAVKL
jgi:hypothetical protein